MQAVAKLVSNAARASSIVVVSSAMSGVTNALVAAAAAAEEGRRADALDELEGLAATHRTALDTLGGDPAVSVDIDRLLEEANDLIRASVYLGELTPRTRDRLLITGEKLAVRLLALALRAEGLDAVPLDADTFLETDDQFGSATPLGTVADRHVVSALRPLLARGVVPVVTGYCGRAPDGATTTLGRGGSDLSATLLAGALGANGVTIWTDVDGVYSADPRVVPEARIIPQLNYREAAELSFYGAKVLHQRTMIPVASAGIPVLTRSSMNPSAPGTVVDGRFTPGSHPVKAISAVRGQSLVSVEGKGMSGIPGVAAKLFGALAERGISVTMISQSSSESSICLAVPGADAEQAEQALKAAFVNDLSRGDVEEIVVRAGVGLVAAVGLGMAQTPGVAARVFAALAAKRVNVLAIAQGSSELNISLAVEDAHVADALRAIHGEFGLERLDTGEDSPRFMDLLLLGCGGIGRTLIRQLLGRGDEVFDRFGLQPRVVGICDRSGYRFEPRGLSRSELEAIVAGKEAGQSLASQGAESGTPDDMLRAALTWRLSRPVLVDVSDSDTADTFSLAFSLGCDVATANKKPLADDPTAWARLRDDAARYGRLLRAEATVGAGLPVVDTLEMLVHTGDRVTSAEGSLSGTLGYLMGRLEDGALLSEAVEQAISLGYTEPDPMQDLSGQDVARKAIILGRLSGLAPHAQVELTGLVDSACEGLPVPELLERLRAEADAPMAARLAAAKEAGLALRYVASVTAGSITVGPVEVPADSALGRLQGTDNLVVFHSERYDARPLVVTGPGAGAEVTAMGVLGDILRIAGER
jgi:bifunctional aspartokinase / homoserine dehydrogenase 1